MHEDLIRRLRWQQQPGAESDATVLMAEAADALEAMQADAARYVKVLQLAGSLIEVARMPNIEYVADDHNASVRVLRQAAIDAARAQE
jgi:hypothetical protein